MTEAERKRGTLAVLGLLVMLLAIKSGLRRGFLTWDAISIAKHAVAVVVVLVLGMGLTDLGGRLHTLVERYILNTRQSFFGAVVVLLAISIVLVVDLKTPLPIDIAIVNPTADERVAKSEADCPQNERDQLLGAAPYAPGRWSKIIRFAVENDDDRPVTISAVTIETVKSKTFSVSVEPEPTDRSHGGDIPKGYVIVADLPSRDNPAQVDMLDHVEVSKEAGAENYVVRVFGRPGTAYYVIVHVQFTHPESNKLVDIVSTPVWIAIYEQANPGDQ